MIIDRLLGDWSFTPAKKQLTRAMRPKMSKSRRRARRKMAKASSRRNR